MLYSAPWFSHDTRPVSEHRWRGVRGWVELSNRGHSVTLASQCNYAAFKDLSEHPEAGFLIQPLLLRTVRTCGGNHLHVAVVKKAEDGSGLIVRLVEMKERTRPTEAKLLLFRPVQTAGHTSMIEEDQDKIVPSGTTISVQCAPAGIETLRLGF